MKKTYIIPELEVLTTTPQTMMALSLVSDEAADNSEVLVKEEGDWDIWDEE